MQLKSDTASAVTHTNLLPIAVIIFLFLLAPKIDSIFTIHSGIVAVLLMTALSVTKNIKQIKVSKSIIYTFIFFAVIGGYNMAVAILYGNNYADFTFICVSISISIAFGWMAAKYLLHRGIKSEQIIDRLLIIITLIAVINSSIILLEFIFPDFKLIIESILLQNSTGLIYAEHPFQLRGFASAGGAGLSVFNAISIVLIIHLVRDNLLKNSVAIAYSLTIVFANVFVGRTGLIISIALFNILLAVVIFKTIKTGVFGIVKVVIAMLLAIIIFNNINYNELDSEATAWAFEWLYNLGTGENLTNSSDDLKTMIYIPENIFHLIFGIGFFEGSNSIYPRTDSGYLKTLLSIGLPLTLILYFTILFLFTKICQVNKKYLILVFSVLSIMLTVEIKEPFLYQNFSARLIFLLAGGSMFIVSSRRLHAKVVNSQVYHMTIKHLHKTNINGEK